MRRGTRVLPAAATRRVGFGDERGDLRHVALDFSAELGAGSAPCARRVLRMFAAVERFVERQTVVALRDGVLAALERVGRGRYSVGA